jgi:hypothetical protein
MVPRIKVSLCLVAALLIAGSLASTARGDNASLALTPAGTADGFTLSTVVDKFGMTSGCCGPLGNAVNSDGNIIVYNNVDGKNYVFHDTDGQVLTNAISSVAFAAFPPAFATSNGAVWTSGGFNGPNAGKLIKLNNDGSINTVYTISGLSVTNGLWTNPVNGHLIAASLIGGGGSGLFDIDVSGGTPTARQINSQSSDGVAVSPDGTTVYTAFNSAVAGYNIASGALVTGPYPVSGVDGMGVITSSNNLNGDIVANTNNGQIFLIDSHGIATLIADHGTRGDYTSADPNGSLLLTQSDELMRLSCGQGCSIGGPPTTPEPASLLLLGSGLAALAGFKRKLLASRS